MHALTAFLLSISTSAQTAPEPFREPLEWTRAATECPPRFAFAAAWDPAGERVLVHAGEAREGVRFVFRNDLWQHTPRDGRWRKLRATGGPGARAYHAAALDERRNALWVFGGTGTDLVAHDELWRLDLASLAWTLVVPEGERPGARFSHALHWDGARDRLVLWGGCKDFRASDNAWTDLWSFDLEAQRWERSPREAPGRWLAASALVPEADLLVAQGGFDGNSGPRRETWHYSLADDRWTEAGKGPHATDAHQALWDPRARRVLFTGGASGARDGHASVWAYDPDARKSKRWEELEITGETPGPHAYHASVLVPPLGALWLFGGTRNQFNDDPRSNDTWMLRLHE